VVGFSPHFPHRCSQILPKKFFSMSLPLHFADINPSALCVGEAAYPFEVVVVPRGFVFDVLSFGILLYCYVFRMAANHHQSDFLHQSCSLRFLLFQANGRMSVLSDLHKKSLIFYMLLFLRHSNLLTFQILANISA